MSIERPDAPAVIKCCCGLHNDRETACTCGGRYFPLGHDPNEGLAEEFEADIISEFERSQRCV